MILHIIDSDKFTKPLAKMMIEDVRFHDHFFISLPVLEQLNSNSIVYLKSPLSKHLWYNFFKLFFLCFKAKKIVLHGALLMHFFFVFPFFLRKTLWVIYGYEINIIKNPKNTIDKITKHVLKKVNGHILHICEESNEVNNILNSKAKFYYSPTYLSNTVELNLFTNKDISTIEKINVLVGNSTDPTNEHISIFEMIENNLSHINKIYCPLSYGDHEVYKNKIIEEAYRKFGDQFVPITNFMSLEEYKEFLNSIDVAIFNHNRQQAMGITLTLMSLGKIVYMRSRTTSYESLIRRGFRVFDNKLIKHDGVKKNRQIAENKKLLEENYSKLNLINFYLSL